MRKTKGYCNLLWVFIGLPVLWIVLGGLVIFVVSLGAYFAYQDKQFGIAARRLPATFPKDEGRKTKNKNRLYFVFRPWQERLRNMS